MAGPAKQFSEGFETAKLGAADAIPTDFLSAYYAFQTGELSLAELRWELANALYDNVESPWPILEFLEAALSSGELEESVYKQLVDDVNQIPTNTAPLAVPKTADNATPPAGNPEENEQRDLLNQEIGPGALLAGRFELKGRAHGGRMGDVFKAIDHRQRAAGLVDSTVAVKLLSEELRGSPEALHALDQEALRAQRLAHPNIVNVFDLEHDGDTHFITMEWLDGEPLAIYLDRNRACPIPAQEVFEILDGVASGLEYAHKQGLVHGDIKPGNIFLSEEGGPKIMDFGVARVIASTYEPDVDDLQAVTRVYASCEMLEGEAPTVADDIFAFAAVAYRMLDGRRPFGSRSALDAEFARLEPSRPAGLNRRQWRALRAALSYRRENRPESVAALMSELRMERRQPTGSASWLGWATAAGIAAVLGLGAAWQWDRLQPGSTSSPANIPLIIEVPGSGPEASPAIDREQDSPLESSDEPVPTLTQANATVAEDTPVVTVSTPDTQGDTEAVSLVIQLDPAADEGAEEAAPPTTPHTSGFQTGRLTVREGDTFVRLRVNNPTPGRTTTLRVAIEPGTALSGEDFLAPVEELLVFEPDQRAYDILLPLVADSRQEHVEEFVVRLAADTTELPLDRSEVVVVIVDDDGLSSTG